MRGLSAHVQSAPAAPHRLRAASTAVWTSLTSFLTVSILAKVSLAEFAAWQLAGQWHTALLASRITASQQRGRFRATVRDESTLDDELRGIFGPRSETVISPSSCGDIMLDAGHIDLVDALFPEVNFGTQFDFGGQTGNWQLQ
jgi:hypothetical protein